MASTYDVGDEVRCTGTFTESDGTVRNPSSVFFSFSAPSDTSATTYEYGVDTDIVRASTGVYYVDLDIDEAGVWRYRWYSTGTGRAADEAYFHVREQEVS